MEIQQTRRSDAAFQQAVDEQDLRVQLRRELNNENIIAVTELNAGLFNTTFHVNTSGNDYILKVAPAQGAAIFYNERHLMQREQSIAEQLQSLSPLVPRYLSFFSIGGRDAFLQPLIPGRLWHDVIDSLSPAENARLWQQLGAFANTLHTQSGIQFGYPAPCRGFSHWPDFIVDNVDGMINDCRRLGVLCNEITTYSNYLPSFYQTLNQVKTPKLLHGDLWPRNVIIGGAGADIHIKAVFDAERAFWGDPVSDWVLLLYNVPASFWQGYGKNLLQTADPACIALYKGMYFILNILEAVRFNESDQPYRQHLAAVNQVLEKYLPAP